jgi:hypothetical protein
MGGFFFIGAVQIVVGFGRHGADHKLSPLLIGWPAVASEVSAKATSISTEIDAIRTGQDARFRGRIFFPKIGFSVGTVFVQPFSTWKVLYASTTVITGSSNFAAMALHDNPS